MSFILDLIIVAIIAIAVIITAKKGFVKTVFRLVGLVLAVLLSLYLSSPIANFIYEKAVEPAISKTIQTTIIENTSEKVITVKEKIADALPAFVRNNIGEPEQIFDNTVFSSENNEQTAKNICDSIVKTPATAFIKTLVTIILIVILSIVAVWLAKLLNGIFSFSVIGKLNSTLGGVLGLVSGCAYAMLFVVATAFIISLTGGFWIFNKEAIGETYIYKTVIELIGFNI